MEQVKIDNKKKIRDYLHLYLGAECMCYNHADREGWKDLITPSLLIDFADPDNSEVEYVSLILRPLSDMTEEERSEVSVLVPSDESPYWVKNIAEVTKWYLDRGFDIFNLIPEGLALDKTKL